VSIKSRWFALAIAVTSVAAHISSISPTHTARAQEFETPISTRDPGRLESLLTAMNQGLPFIPGEVLVKFRPGAQAWQQASVLRVLRTEVNSGNSRWIGDVLHIRSAEITDPEHASFLLRNQPEVLYAHPNYIRRNKSVPNDTNYSIQWNFQAINLPTAWDINPGGRTDVLVAVIDSGLTTTDNTFGFRIWDGRAFRTFAVPLAKMADFDHTRVRAGREFVLGGGWFTAAGDPILFDADGHGSHVAGTIAQQTNNNEGFAGIAYRTTLLPLKVCFAYWDVQLEVSARGIPAFVDPDFAGCPTDAIVQALRYAADSGAKVINMSIGGPNASAAERDALQYAVSKGSFVSISAGNEARDGNPPSYPAAFAPSIEGVMSVGAVNRRLTRASYSNFGSYVEIAAPGGGDGPTTDNIWQMGPLQADLSPNLFSPRFDRSQTYGIAGTSMASPHVAGVAALLYSQGITRPAAIEQALKRFARDLGPKGRDDEYGAGLVDARTALRGLGLGR
jgi:serine protease